MNLGGWDCGKNYCWLVICCRSVASVSSSVFFFSFSQYVQQSGPNGARQMGFSRHFDHEVAASQYIESVLFSSSGFLHDCTVPSERNCKPAKTEFGRVELLLTPGELVQKVVKMKRTWNRAKRDKLQPKTRGDISRLFLSARCF